MSLVDVAQLRIGLAMLDGTVIDGLTVLTRITSELQKMTTNAQLLLQKQNIAAGALDNWSSIIDGFNARKQMFDDDLVGREVGTGGDTYERWDDLRAFAVEVATASNQLSDELNPSQKWLWLGLVVLLVAFGIFYLEQRRGAA
jgi:hypothetical protein